jgi:hypothetical protein
MVFGLSTGYVYMHEAEVNSRVYERVILGLRIENQVTWCKVLPLFSVPEAIVI